MRMTGSTDKAIAQRLAAELAQVECRFAAELLSDLPCVNGLVAHIERYRGKMLRPTLVFVSGMASARTSGVAVASEVLGACQSPGRSGTDQAPELAWSVPPNTASGGLTEGHRIVATVVEMVHMATLVHDDILDDADIRRRGATVNRLSGNETAVMLGDYLISHAYHLGAGLANPEVTRMIGAATNTVCEGELLQLANRNNADLDEATYFEIIRRKTASLCGACCQVAAVLHGAPQETVKALYDYGEKLGLAFQIVDDLLDLVGEEDTVGKTLGRDLAKGKLTLPLIHCLRTAAPAEHAWLWDYARYGSAAAAEVPGPTGSAADLPHSATSAGPSPTAPARVRGLLQTRGSIVYARQYATRLAQAAKATLGALPDTNAKVLLMQMADGVVTRTF
jgi:octaprenyl-diphosphate synthase